MKFIAAAITLFASLSVQTYQYCAGLEKDDLIQSGTVQFVNKDNLTQETCHNVNLAFPVPSQGVQVAISATDLNKYRPKGGLDYSVRGGQKGNGISLSFLAGDTNWSKVSASYFVTARNDIIAGSFIADTFQLFGCDKNKVDKATIKHSVNNFKRNGKYQVATFISGIKTLDRYINVKIQDQSINNAGDIQLKLTSNANPSVQNLYINYIAWQIRAPFTFKPFSSIKNAKGQYNIAGITQFRNSIETDPKGIALFTSRIGCIGSNCPSGCLANQAACKRIYGQIIDGICIACKNNQSYINGQCVLACKPYEQNIRGKCVPKCDNYQTYSNGKCVCIAGYVKKSNKCTKCPSESTQKSGKCVCNKVGYWFDESKFICAQQLPSCPPRSKWNQRKLQCQCIYNGQYLIKNKCQKCGPNQGWNGQQCVCVSDYYKVNGSCQKCDINASYNGRECVCNHGFYDRSGKCEKCHHTCGKCNGPNAHQCTACSDVSFTLKDGYCTRGTPCPTGLFLDGKQCKPCSSYCQICTSQDTCDQCIQGFDVQKLYFQGKEVSYCTQTCGDGRRFQLDCDDGNKRNNDGCDKNCVVESGYTCQGGSSIKPSNCVSFAPQRSYITTTGTTHLFGRIVQGIRLSHIPESLTKNQCAQCSKLLWIRVISSQVVPGIRLNYLPKSKYQFLAEFQFNGLFSIPVFSFTVQINPDYAQYFSKEDMAQIQVKKVDPALLIKHDVPTALSLDNLDKIDIPDNLVDDIFS